MKRVITYQVIGLNNEVLEEKEVETFSDDKTFKKRKRHSLLLDGKMIKKDYKTIKLIER